LQPVTDIERPMKDLPIVFKEKQFWLLILLGLVFFYRPLFNGETLYFRDLSGLHLLQKSRLVEYIHNHELPLWDRYIQGGQSYIGHITGDPLYPSNLLYFFLPLLTAFNWDLVLHLIFCSVSAYSLSRVVGLNTLSSFLVGIIYAYSGHTLSKMNLYFRLLVLPYLPLLILFWHLYLSRGQRRWFILSVLAGALQILAGALEVVAMHFLILLGWTILYSYRSSIRRRILSYALLAFFSIGITSVQLLPTAEVVSHSYRPHGFSYSSFTQWSVNPKRLLEFVVPGFLGFKDTLDKRSYWGKELEDLSTPFILSLYFGFPVIMLGMTAALHKGSNSVFPRKLRIYLISLFLVGAFLSLGRFLPGFSFLYRILPPIRFIRYPVKFLNLSILPISLLAGYAAQIYFGGGENSFAPGRNFVATGWLITLLAFFCTAGFYSSTKLASGFEEFFFHNASGLANESLASSFLHASCICLATTLLYQFRLLRPEKNILWMMVVVVSADLLIAGLPVNFMAPRELFDQPRLVAKVSSELREGRLYRTPSSVTALRAPSNELMWGYRWEIELLNGSTAVLYGIPLAMNDDLDGLAQDTLLRLKSTAESLPWPQRVPILTASGVSLIITEHELDVQTLQLIGTIHSESNSIFYLYRNPSARAFFFVNQSRKVNSPEMALQQMTDITFHPENFVLLQNPAGISPATNCEAANVERLEFGNNDSRFSIQTKCDGYLVFTEPFFPGWRLYVDGKVEPLLQANYTFSAGFLRAGSHLVEKRYLPFSFLLGAILSGVSLLLLALAIYMKWPQPDPAITRF
jgi:Bacterial membrane protein YfhO